jgi:hypothetical protein
LDQRLQCGVQPSAPGRSNRETATPQPRESVNLRRRDKFPQQPGVRARGGVRPGRIKENNLRPRRASRWQGGQRESDGVHRPQPIGRDNNRRGLQCADEFAGGKILTERTKQSTRAFHHDDFKTPAHAANVFHHLRQPDLLAFPPGG